MTRVVSLLGIASLVLGVAMSSAAFAQPGGQGGPGGGMRGGMGGGRGMGGMRGAGGSNPLDLLGIEQVQKELDLVDDQKTDLREIGEQLRDKFRTMFSGMEDLPQEQRRAEIEKLRTKMEKEAEVIQEKIADVLMPHQSKRLREIFVQIQGTRALDNKDIAKELKITADQTKKMGEARNSLREAMQGMFQEMQGLDQEERWAKMTEMREKREKERANIDKKVLAVLSTKQQAQFAEMKGKPFELDRQAMFGGRGQGRGPQQGTRPGGGRPGTGAARPGGGRTDGGRQGGRQGGRFGGDRN